MRNSAVKALIAIALGFFILRCATHSETVPPTSLIKAGMSKSEVVDILGPPENLQYKENIEAWQYCQVQRFNPVNKVLIVWVYEGRVTGVTTYQNVGLGACGLYYKTIDWNDAPDKTVNR